MGTTASLVPLHPEPVPGDTQALRWVIAAGTLAIEGEVTAPPSPLDSLLADGTVESLAVAPTAVSIRLAPGRAWRRDGARVRSALQAALELPERWSALSGGADDVLRSVVQDVIDGPVGMYVRSHGGAIELLEVADGHVRVRLAGACSHCPSAKVTLDERFEKAVRARYPAVRSVTARPAAGLAGARRRLPLTVARHDPAAG